MELSELQALLGRLGGGMTSGPWEAIQATNGDWQLVKAVNRTPVLMSEANARFIVEFRNIFDELGEMAETSYSREEYDALSKEMEESDEKVGKLEELLDDSKTECEELQEEIEELKEQAVGRRIRLLQLEGETDEN